MGEVGVVLLGPPGDAAGLAPRCSFDAVTGGDAGELRTRAAVVGLAVEPWPAFAREHDRVRDAVSPAPYFAVQSWHLHPAYVDRLASAVERTRSTAREDLHVLFTAPGPEAEPEPGEVVFLRETAEAVSARLGLARRSIAWTSGVLGPSSLAALTALTEAHGRSAVLHCSLDPLSRTDDVAAEAAHLGVELTAARLDRDDLAAVLEAVVATVVDHEQLERAGR
ncbi:MAG: hypothetical protein KY461_03195 [Actinobacteria bacterium]|nr:hypothetical protein [Actinomycetota bacterium]